MPINRLVAFAIKPILTLAFAVAAAWITRHFPGLDWDGNPGLDSEAAAAAEIAASALAFAVAGFITSRGIDKWLEGWIKHEENQTLLELQGIPESPAGEANREEQTEPEGIDTEETVETRPTIGAVGEGEEYPSGKPGSDIPRGPLG